MTMAKQRAQDGQPPERPYLECDNPLADHYAMGQLLGVTGTPAMVTTAGEMMPGYLPAKELARKLGVL